MTSVQRLAEYRTLPKEAPVTTPSDNGVANWPPKGRIQFENLCVRYRESQPKVLSDLSMTIEGGQTVGCVGRTGAGKSTLLASLFRLMEPASGTIKIDGVDISTLGLRKLRQSMGIIPQEPTIFTGTVRTNLDPIATGKTEADFETALRRCHFYEHVIDLGAAAYQSRFEKALELGGTSVADLLARHLLIGTDVDRHGNENMYQNLRDVDVVGMKNSIAETLNAQLPALETSRKAKRKTQQTEIIEKIRG
eukprot:SAG31_NODE_5522_length_2481_cov_1.638959_3_plen_250_part_00